ncbi:unnamed protein product [Phyllotreta striolata]|uniref:Osiris 10 n=1 Tax=Phyllotreta striolata TaxID=444603 RepID=A0A9N9XQ64_PHYSR|nr:unnamed protein product [Phyllotreta striolata]
MLLGFAFALLQAILPVLCTNNASIDDTFRQCLLSQMPANLGHCLGVGAIDRLQSLDNSPEFELVDGLMLTRDVQEFRDAYNFQDRDPSNLRGIFDSMNYVFSKRNLKWNMGFIYPGLAMHVAPSGQPGGTLEFVLDPHREAINVHSLKEAGTGRLLARQFLLPMLLGFKFNVISLVPILFGVLALIAKKAVVLSKLALVVSSAFALGSLLFGYSQNYPSQHYGNGHYGQYGHIGHGGHHGIHGGIHGGHFGHAGHGVHGFKYSAEEDDYSDSILRETNGRDQLNVYPNVVESIGNAERLQQKKGRNFAWSENETNKNVKPT